MIMIFHEFNHFHFKLLQKLPKLGVYIIFITVDYVFLNGPFGVVKLVKLYFEILY